MNSCQEFFRASGWHCAEVASARFRMLYVSTPVTFPNGRPIDFFIKVENGLVHVMDDGLTLMALKSLGYALDKRANWRGLTEIAARFGFELSEAGILQGIFKDERNAPWGGNLLRLVCRIAEWEAEKGSSRDVDLTLTEEVERLMRQKDPDKPLKVGATFRTDRGEDLDFDFLWGDLYVDAISPTAQATAAGLRKAIQFSRSLNAGVEQLYIVDDRENLEKATREVAILGQVTTATRLSEFDKFYRVAA